MSGRISSEPVRACKIVVFPLPPSPIRIKFVPYCSYSAGRSKKGSKTLFSKFRAKLRVCANRVFNHATVAKAPAEIIPNDNSTIYFLSCSKTFSQSTQDDSSLQRLAIRDLWRSHWAGAIPAGQEGPLSGSLLQ